VVLSDIDLHHFKYKQSPKLYYVIKMVDSNTKK